MTDRLVRLVWDVYPAGYKIAKRTHRPGTGAARLYGDGVQDCIVPAGPKMKKYQTALLEHEVFRDLANSARRPGPEGVLQFVNKWGLLTKSDWRESLERFMNRREGFLDFMSGKLTPHFAAELGPFIDGVGYLETHLETRRGRPQLFFQADTLLQFCVLEFIQATAGGIDLTACDACGALLPLHKKGRPKRYCDDACKMKAYRGNHRDEINRGRRESRAKGRSS
jgi:hypothetical protein